MNLHLSFHTIIILAYTIPNIYLFLRIGNLFINKGFRVRFTVIYITLALIYPYSNLFSGITGGSRFLSALADYLLPFYLYLFIFLLTFDILLIINRFIRIVPISTLKSTRFKKGSLAAILFLSLLVVIGGVINLNTIRTSRYTIEIPRKSSSIRHLRIAFAADFHLQERTGIHFVERFAAEIEALSPDIMIFGGDIIEGDRDDGNIGIYESILKGIHTRYGTWTVLGNHEYYGGQERGAFFKKSGMIVLCDSLAVMDGAFTLAGRYDSHFRARSTVTELLSPASDSLPVILVDHRPTEIEEVSTSMADIQLSGHTHNGQLFPINLITRSVYMLSWGHLKKGNTHFFVTSGIRLWGPPVRTTGKSEIMVIDVDFI